MKNIESNLLNNSVIMAGAGFSVRMAAASMSVHNPGRFFCI